MYQQITDTAVSISHVQALFGRQLTLALSEARRRPMYTEATFFLVPVAKVPEQLLPPLWQKLLSAAAWPKEQPQPVQSVHGLPTPS